MHNRMNGLVLLTAILLSLFAVNGCRTAQTMPSATRKVFGANVTITVYDAGMKQKDLEPVFNEIFGSLTDWETKTLATGPQNQLAAIARGAGQQSIPSDGPVFDLLMKSLRLYDASGKVFDIRYGPMLDLWGIDSKPRVPTPAELDTAKLLVGEGGMFVAGNSILLAKKGMRFDVREIAAGFALDLAAAKLAEKGIRTATICTPTVCRTMGDPPDKRGFKITFANPAGSDSAWATVWAPVGGLAYASIGDGKFSAGGKSYHRHLDPRTGMPATVCDGAIVQSADAATAQAMAYSLFVAGSTDGFDKDGKASVAGSVMLRNDGGKMSVTKSGSLADRFESKQ